MGDFHKILQEYWGYTAFRPLQEEIIQSVFEGKDTLGLMPTGGGKSLTFQVPAMAMDGICLVVTPLIALMKDQVDNLRKRGIKALAVYSGMTHQEILTTLENAILGDYKFLYVSPERLGSDLFLTKLQNMNVSLLVVDESHCISQWGYDFRPSYMNIFAVRDYFPQVPVLALTATATPQVVEDIQQSLHFKKRNVFQKSFGRKNLSYIVRTVDDKFGELVRIMDKVSGSAIVYVRSRLKTKEIATILIKNGLSADFYHAGLSPEDKHRKQNAWMNNECRIIVSTNAFGMGIDKPDVRVVVHMDMPNSLEEYYQEAGRAGRDEQLAYAILLYNKPDSTKLKKRISDEFPPREFVKYVYEQLAYFFQVAEGFGFQSVFDFNLPQFCSVYKLPMTQTHNALKILQLAGYIEYIDETDNRSRLMFTIYRDELYNYKFDTDQGQLIQAILRQYTGLFADYVTIDEAFLSVKVGLRRQEVYDMLVALSKRNIVDYIPHKKTPFIVYVKSRVNLKYLEVPKTVYENRKIRFENRIEGMIGYVDNNEVCRSRMLLAYFGEKDSVDCGLCDYCRNKNHSGISNYLFNKIDVQLRTLLKDKRLSVAEITDSLTDFNEGDVIKVIRYNVNAGEFALNMDLVSLVSNNN